MPSVDLKLIRNAAQFAKDRGVSDLEAVVTAAWIVVKENLKDEKEIANSLTQLKPHISKATAQQAAFEALGFINGNR